MAFQDSADGIIIDAVLTDKGRKYMAQGKFRVAKFALGDDEVNYSFVHETGGGDEGRTMPSAHKTPILEAFSNENANINYGLLSITSDDVLYIPKIRVNEKVKETVTAYNGYYYVAVNNETARKLETDIGKQFVLQNNEHDKNKLLIESGISIPPNKSFGGITTEYASDLRPTTHNKEAYILNMDLYDKHFMVYTDERFVENILTSPLDSHFENDNSNNLYMRLGPLQASIQTSLPGIVDYYETYRVNAVDQSVVSTTSGVNGDNHSAFDGPRATIFAMNLKINQLMTADSQSSTNFRYSKFGYTNQAMFGTSNRYDFINSTIYVQGLSTNSRLIIPIRIIRFSGTS